MQARSVITGLLAKNPAERLTVILSASRRDSRAVLQGEKLKGKALFEGVDWDALLARQIEPPFVPLCREKEGTNHMQGTLNVYNSNQQV